MNLNFEILFLRKTKNKQAYAFPLFVSFDKKHLITWFNKNHLSPECKQYEFNLPQEPIDKSNIQFTHDKCATGKQLFWQTRMYQCHYYDYERVRNCSELTEL